MCVFSPSGRTTSDYILHPNSAGALHLRQSSLHRSGCCKRWAQRASVQWCSVGCMGLHGGCTGGWVCCNQNLHGVFCGLHGGWTAACMQNLHSGVTELQNAWCSVSYKTCTGCSVRCKVGGLCNQLQLLIQHGLWSRLCDFFRGFRIWLPNGSMG